MKWFSVVVSAVLLLLGLAIVTVKASPYNKYGRSCKDILCIAGQEECVMEQDECTTYSSQCGTYPTCKRKAGAQKKGCASLRCESGHFCSIRQENCSLPPCEIKPVCIAFRTTPASSSAVNKPSYSSSNYGGSTYSQRRSGGGGSYNYGTNTGQRNSWSWGSG